MAFDNVVDTITMEEIVPMCVDTVLRSNTFTTVALARPKTFRAATQDFPIKLVALQCPHCEENQF